jgi:hypothetical protein
MNALIWLLNFVVDLYYRVGIYGTIEAIQYDGFVFQTASFSNVHLNWEGMNFGGDDSKKIDNKFQEKVHQRIGYPCIATCKLYSIPQRVILQTIDCYSCQTSLI